MAEITPCAGQHGHRAEASPRRHFPGNIRRFTGIDLELVDQARQVSDRVDDVMRPGGLQFCAGTFAHRRLLRRAQCIELLDGEPRLVTRQRNTDRDAAGRNALGDPGSVSPTLMTAEAG